MFNPNLFQFHNTPVENILIGTDFFTVIASNGFHPNSTYNVAVSSHTYKEDIELSVSIASTSTPSYTLLKNTEVKPNSTNMLAFEIGDWPSGPYKIVVSGIKNVVNFNKEQDLRYLGKECSVHIQTDKATYKPNDLIQFRIIILDSHLKPYNARNKKISININDAGDNRLKQFNNIKLVKGVFKSNLQLTENPPLGTWRINVLINDCQEGSKTFVVEKYVLPKFKVDVVTTRHTSFTEGKISAVIESKYTYGQYVRGKLNVEIYTKHGIGPHNQYSRLPENVLATRLYTNFTGKENLDLTFSEIKLSPMYETDIEIKATVTEALTDKEIEAQGIISIHKHPFKIELIGSSKYKTEQPYKGKVRLINWDNTPVTNASHIVDVTIESSTGSFLFGRMPNMNNQPDQKSFCKKTGGVVKKNGILEFEFVPVAEFTNYQISAKVGENEASNLRIRKDISSSSNKSIQLELVNEKLQINSPVEINVTANDKFKNITYLVIGQGNILIANTISSEKDTSTAKICFDTNRSFLPKSRILVFYLIGITGKFISDFLDLEFPPSFQNNIEIGLEQEEVRPGANACISIKTNPNSYVGLLGVDQSVLLLRSNNDLNKDNILNSLSSYSCQPVEIEYDGFDNQPCVMISNALKKPQPRNYGLFGVPQAMAFRAAPAGMAQMSSGMLFGAPAMAVANMQSQQCFGQVFKTNQLEKPIKPRKDFPETWIFDDIEDFDCQKSSSIMKKKVPDSITKWIITGFAIDPETGFGMVDNPTTLTTFLPFFLRLELPYSVKRGETVAIQVIVFNYLSHDTSAEVVFKNENKDFEWAEFNSAKHTVYDYERTKNVKIPPNDGITITFLIKPIEIGRKILKVSATTPTSGDSVETPLLVEAEGIEKYKNNGFLIDLRENSVFDVTVPSGFPEEFVEDSDSITVSCVGDILGATITNLDSLIQMPYGCGEQTMLSFVPNVVIMKYIKITNQLTSDIESKALKCMEAGYQRELTFKHDDGSFSAFGKSDKTGSTWLTAFVIKSFVQAQKIISIDESIIQCGFGFLISRQKSDGSFEELGNVIHKDMQGGSSSGIALVAYVLTAFLESPEHSKLYSSKITNAVNFLLSKFDETTDIYTHGVLAYALQFTNHSQRESVLQKFIDRKKEENQLIWWEKQMPESNKCGRYCWNQPSSVNVELTAYGLLALIKAGRVTECIPILKWLISQQNQKGGFCSTQDTCVGITAMSELSAAVYSNDQNVELTIQSDDEPVTLQINQENANVLQQIQINPKSSNIKIHAEGKGFCLCNVSFKYNANNAKANPRFKLSATIEEKSSNSFLSLRVKTNYIPDIEAGDTRSNMALIEINLPSGFVGDEEKLIELIGSNRIAKTEMKNNGTILVLYLDYCDENEIEFVVSATQSVVVSNLKPVPITIIDYYDNLKSAEYMYDFKMEK